MIGDANGFYGGWGEPGWLSFPSQIIHKDEQDDGS